MTREEEIQKLIDEEMGIDNYGSSDYQVGLSDGVRLADKTMIKKACEWLKNYRQNYDGTGYIPGIVNDETIEEFRKAMESEIYISAMEMAEWKDFKIRDLLMTYTKWLYKRGFFAEYLQCDFDHQIDTFLEMSKNK